MIKNSYFSDEIKNLKRKYRAENVMVSTDGKFVMFRAFSPPGFFKKKIADVVFEIPEGFGFGVNIFNVYILLNRKFEKKHLYQVQEKFSAKFPGFEKYFGLLYDKGTYKTDRWFWICFHMWGDPLFDKYLERSTSGKGSREDFMVGLYENILVIKLVLEAIAKGDKKMLLALRDMGRNRQKYLDDQEKTVEEFILQNNWKSLRWMY